MVKRVGMLRKKLGIVILTAITAGLIVGVLLSPQTGLVSPYWGEVFSSWFAIPGHLFLAIIQMIVIPLIFASIIRGIADSGNLEQIKILGSRIFVYFLFTTTIAIIIGLSLGLLIKPGSFVEPSASFAVDKTIEHEEIIELNVETLPEMIVNIVPVNIFKSMVERDMLATVIFAIIVGVALSTMSALRSRSFLNLINTVQEFSLVIVRWAMYLVPFAVFGLLVEAVVKMGLDVLVGMGVYVGTVILGLLIMLVVYLFIVAFFVKMNPFAFLQNIKEAQLLAFSTSSSAAVMPLSMEIAEEKLKVKPGIVQILIPLGTTINMDGTALYQAIATIFLAQVFGVELSVLALLLILITTIGASIGSPGTPGVGIVILAMVLAGVGIPAAGIALILAVDRILDMCRTTINVSGDLTASLVMNRLLKHKTIFDH